MRLICPNCTAEYEIPEDAIPAVGRDLQCSSCGVTWFSKPPVTDPEMSGDLSKVLATQPPSEAAGTAETTVRSSVAASGADLPPLDTAIADVLRQEAAAEVRLRSQDTAGGLESQPDLGLESADKINTSQRHARESQERIGRMRGVGEQANSSEQPSPSPASGGGAQTSSLQMLTPWVPACVYQTAPSPKKMIRHQPFIIRLVFLLDFSLSSSLRRC